LAPVFLDRCRIS